MKKIISLTTLLFSIMILIVISGCEDDALLTPKIESECTGSYCSLNLPGSSINSKYENPKIF
tara:strand:+ start:646 stop:831 length:186 start_codon:yes stop_codon:yes gene_type:complete